MNIHFKFGFSFCMNSFMIEFVKVNSKGLAFDLD